MKPNFEPKKCECCGQTVEYLLPVDKGTVDILKAISIAIRKKGVNEIHPRNEMEVQRGQISYREMVQEGILTSNHVGNLSRPRFHGLIARTAERGHYCITRKGAKFLKGEPIPRYAIISKSEKKNIGYYGDLFEGEKKCLATIEDFSHEEEYWELPDYIITNF